MQSFYTVDGVEGAYTANQHYERICRGYPYTLSALHRVRDILRYECLGKDDNKFRYIDLLCKCREEIDMVITGISVARIQMVVLCDKERNNVFSMYSKEAKATVSVRRYFDTEELYIHVENSKGQAGGATIAETLFMSMSQREFDSIIQELLYYAE